MLDCQSTIGVGGFSVVKRATWDGFPCAVKFLRDDLVADDDCYARFRREVRHLFHLQGGAPIAVNRVMSFIEQHHIVPLIARNLKDGNNQPWFAMPLAEQAATTYLSKQHGVKELWLFKETCTGVSYAHEKGLIHRDLKPSNILLFKSASGDLVAAVSDFGIGRFVIRDTPTLTGSNIQIGTPTYWSPEQEKGQSDVDKLSDIYSLGKVLYEVLTGLSPASTDLHLLQSDFARIVDTATKRDRCDRFQSVNDLMGAFP